MFAISCNLRSTDLSDYTTTCANGKLLTHDEKKNHDSIINEVIESREGISNFTSPKYRHFQFDMPKGINYTAFLARLTPDQRKRLSIYTSLNIEDNFKQDIALLLKHFKEISLVNCSSELFKKGLAAMVVADIISQRQIDYILGI